LFLLEDFVLFLSRKTNALENQMLNLPRLSLLTSVAGEISRGRTGTEAPDAPDAPEPGMVAMWQGKHLYDGVSAVAQVRFPAHPAYPAHPVRSVRRRVAVAQVRFPAYPAFPAHPFRSVRRRLPPSHKSVFRLIRLIRRIRSVFRHLRKTHFQKLIVALYYGFMQ